MAEIVVPRMVAFLRLSGNLFVVTAGLRNELQIVLVVLMSMMFARWLLVLLGELRLSAFNRHLHVFHLESGFYEYLCHGEVIVDVIGVVPALSGSFRLGSNGDIFVLS